MTAYLFIQLKVTDKQRFLQYTEAARGIAPKFGGKYLSTGRPLEVLEGEGIAAPIVLTEWPSADHIRAFWNSAEYQAAIPLRLGAAEVQATILDGNEDATVKRAAQKAKS
jgi:uncharacterized protein (DUF1330 family)